MKIHNFVLVLVEWDISSHYILSQKAILTLKWSACLFIIYMFVVYL